MLSLWIPLVSVDANSGCLSLVRGSHKLGKIQEAGSHQGGGSGWPNGLAQYGTVCEEAMEPGDGARTRPCEPCAPILLSSCCGFSSGPAGLCAVLAFHNLCMHGTAPNHRPDRVRWSIDLRYQPSDLGFGWHNLRDDFETRFPCMTVASADPAKETS